MTVPYIPVPSEQAEYNAMPRLSFSVRSEGSVNSTNSAPVRGSAIGRAITTLGSIADPGSGMDTNPVAAVLRGAPAPLAVEPEERLQELISSGTSRREALRQVTRENMNAEAQLGVVESIEAGALPIAWSCGVCCGAACLVFFFTLIITCLAVAICTILMNLVGFGISLFFAVSGCDQQVELRQWLLLIQAVCIAEGCLSSFFKSRSLAFRERFPVLSSTVSVLYTFLAGAFRACWCLHAQALVTSVAKEDGCAAWLPRFMGVFASVLLLQTLVVVPVMSLCMHFVQWAAAHGHLSTRRGAKTGTLENMKSFTYSPDAFAASDDPNDVRPQDMCPVCLESYSQEPEKAIVQTPCSPRPHLMHSECLGKWLQMSHYCPICRGDLEDAENTAV